MRTSLRISLLLLIFIPFSGVSGAEPVAYSLGDETAGCDPPRQAPLASDCEEDAVPGPATGPDAAPGTADRSRRDRSDRTGAGDSVGDTDVSSYYDRLSRRSLPSGSSGEYASLAPGMIGDSFFTRGQILGMTPSAHGGVIDIPGMRRAKIGENNSPLPRDRFYFTYQHFHNAIRAEDFSWEVPGYAFRQVDFSVNRYVLGFERTFFDEWCSVDVRVPLQDSVRFNASPWPPFPGVNDFLFTARPDAGILGNISLTLKSLLYESQTTAVSAGIMLDLPTGPNVSGTMYYSPYQLQNESVHLGPFVGALYEPNEDWFFQGFLQVDIDPNGSSFLVQDLFDPPAQVGTVQDQTLLYLDISAGRWLLRRPGSLCTGVAGLVELHYTTTLQDADLVRVSGADLPVLFNYLEVGNLYNRSDVLNLTTGLHFQFARGLDLRVAGAVPLRSPESDRCFDFEAIAQVNWMF